LILIPFIAFRLNQIPKQDPVGLCLLMSQPIPALTPNPLAAAAAKPAEVELTVVSSSAATSAAAPAAAAPAPAAPAPAAAAAPAPAAPAKAPDSVCSPQQKFARKKICISAHTLFILSYLV
jgi:hypothetical protein